MSKMKFPTSSLGEISIARAIDAGAHEWESRADFRSQPSSDFITVVAPDRRNGAGLDTQRPSLQQSGAAAERFLPRHQKPKRSFKMNTSSSHARGPR